MKDLCVRHKGNKLYFNFLKWDTEFFGVKAYALNINKSKISSCDASLKKLLLEASPKVSFITAKLPGDASPETIGLFLGHLGFKYIDTAAMLLLKRKVFPGILCGFEYPTKICVKKIEKNRGLPYSELGSAFRFTRFHRDSRIGIKKANQLWIEFIKNFTPNQRNHMFIAQINNKVVGVALLQENNGGKGKIAELCFLSVIKGYQGRGVGSGLIKEARTWCLKKGVDMLAGTQLKNIKALNFYLQNGFLVKSIAIVMHKWI